jgi:hypothetical protein
MSGGGAGEEVVGCCVFVRYPLFYEVHFHQHDGSVLQRAHKPLAWVGTMLEYSCAIKVEVCFSSGVVTEFGENKRVRGIDMSH